MEIKAILKKHWGFDGFRPLQEDIIHAVLDGKDVLALLPTGGGKSVCFQVPALAQEGICLVISPLIALIKDQVDNLKKKGIQSLAIYSGMSFMEVKKTLQNAAYGNYKFLYVSPERLETNLFLDYLPSMKINMIAVDEAHCISQWGYDFRPSYLRIAALREQLPKVPVLALTASATAEVQDDICQQLLFGRNSRRFQQSFERPNLSYSVFNTASRQNKMVDIINNVPGTAIVYCKSRKRTREIAEILQLNGISADYYHAGLGNEERSLRQQKWISGSTRVMACTNAFGMGIDKPDVRVVIHYDLPDCLENYYQEAGRAGRDGKKSYAVLFYSERETEQLRAMSALRYPSHETIRNIYTGLMNHLQVAAGGGAGMSADFDLSAFCKAFRFDALETSYAIKVLEQEGVLEYNESFFNPSTLVFNCSREELHELENSHPKLDEVSKGLLRSYEGIFDFPAVIYESQLSQFLRLPVNDIKSALIQLSRLGLVHYSPQKETPQIRILQNRMYADSFRLNLANHLERKKQFEKRVDAMIDYTTEKTVCRSRYIAAYFNDPHLKSCGICDNCISRKKIELGSREFEKISNEITGILKTDPQSIKQLLNHFHKTPREKFWKVMDYLLAENKLEARTDGKIIVRM